MRRFLLVLLGGCVAVTAGCGRKEVTALQRKQGANFMSEAQFAVTLRDFTRAEGLLAQAAAACPDNPDYWLSLGTIRRKLENRSGAKTAFEEALSASRASYKHDARNAQQLLQQVYILALLGRTDDARDLLEKARKDHPDNRNIRAFAEGKELDRLIADPGFKDLAI